MHELQYFKINKYFTTKSLKAEDIKSLDFVTDTDRFKSKFCFHALVFIFTKMEPHYAKRGSLKIRF